MDGNFVLDQIEKMVEPHRGIWEDPFRILITGIMSTRTKDEVTDRASLRLFCRFPNLKEVAKSTPMEIEKLIKPVGFYRIKARSIVNTSKLLLKEYGSEVPGKLDDLISLPGVGRKVANIVLAYGIGTDALAVDTHVQRVSYRLGLSSSKVPEVTERILKRKVAKKRWNEVNSYFVSFGKKICRPIGPRCNVCLLRSNCRYWNHENRD